MGLLLFDAQDPEFLAAGSRRIEFGTRRRRTATGVNTVSLSPKDPDSEEIFERDCTLLLQTNAGGTIESIEDEFFEEGDGACTVLVSASLDSTSLKWSVKLGGGTDGVTYRYTVEFVTTAGERLQASIEFFCANAIN